MNFYRVIVARRAKKYLDKLPPSDRKRIITKIKFISADPFASHPNITKIKGETYAYRLRIGNVRVVYDLDTQLRIIFVWKIAPRGSIYKP